MFRLDYINKKLEKKEIHGFKTPKDANDYMKNHQEEDFGENPLILYDSERYA